MPRKLEEGLRNRAFRNEPTMVALRPRQRLLLEANTTGHAYRVEKGCAMVDLLLAGERRSVLMLLYPGDVVSKHIVPAVPGLGVTAAVPTALQRFSIQSGTALSAAAGDSAGLLRRAGLHAIVVGRLTGEERLATLLLELGLTRGIRTSGGCVVDLPLSRADMADYLALNPDTLSRLLTRLKSRNVIALPARSRAILKDMDRLEQMTPVAATVNELFAVMRGL